MKELALDLLKCESESAVEAELAKIAKKISSMKWHPLDGRETNFNVVTNQAASGPKALTELCTNMVDAILLRHAAEKNIDPCSSLAPKSVIDAVKNLVSLPGARSGILAEVDNPSHLRTYARQNLVIGVTSEGRGKKPCFTFVDSGEGQRPEDFEQTFLSLSSGRKKDIPFVQGKYNMGSSGVLSYCGRKWYKMTISKRFDGSSPWGWTIVRRRPGDGAPIAEYLKIDGVIPSFDCEEIYPFVRQDGELYDECVRRTGTIVKLYSYEFGAAANFRTIREALNENLVSTILPFRLMDFRTTPSRKRRGARQLGIDERTVNGMDFQLRRIDDPEEDNRDEASGTPIHVADINHPELGTIRIHAVPLPRSLPGWLETRRNNNRVYHSVNGQVQFKQGRAFISQRCRRPGLKDRVVILVDASEMTEAAHNDVWKGDRETIRQTEIGNLYVSEIERGIRRSETLKALQDSIAREETEHLTKEAESDLFKSVVAADPHIAQLLPGGTTIRLSSGLTQRKVVAPAYEGQHSPTFLKLVGRSLRNEGIDLPEEGTRRVRFETDARNDWLTRLDCRGKVMLRGEAESKVSFSANLHNGSLSLTLSLAGLASAGETFEARVTLLDDAMSSEVVESVTIRIVQKRASQPSGPRRPPDVDDGNMNAEVETKDMPQTKWLTKDGRPISENETENWPADFDDQDGGVLQELSEDVRLYKINYDNAHFQHFLKKERDESSRKVIIEQYRLGMLVLMMGFEDAYAKSKRNNNEDKLGEHSDEFRRIAARGAATVVMSIARTLPQMVNQNSVGDPDDA